MDDKMLKQPAWLTEEIAAALASEDEVALESLASTLEDKIRMLEEKEQLITEKLLSAKQRGFLTSANKCRALLQKIARYRAEVNAALSAVRARLGEISAKREIEEISALAEEIDAELFLTAQELTEIECPSFAPVSHHAAKSKRLSFIAKLFAWMGILGGLIGALAYMLLVEFNYAHFRLTDLAIFGGMIVGMALIGMIFGICANHQRKLADKALAQVEEDMRAYEAAVAEQQEILDAGCVPWRHENTTSAARVDAMEYEAQRAVAKAAAEDAEKARADRIKEKLGARSKKLIPVAVACVAIAWIATRSKRRKQKTAKKALLSLLVDR